MIRAGLSNSYVRVSLIVIFSLAVLTALGLYLRGGRSEANTSAMASDDDDGFDAVARAIRVNAVHPRPGDDFAMTDQRPADVEPYYAAELESRVPGVVSKVNTAIGHPVKKGDVLIEVEVPDLVQSVREKERVVVERERDRELAVVNIKTAEAAVKTARAEVKVKQKAILLAEANLAYRYKLLVRLKDLRARNGIEQEVVDDAQRNYDAAAAEKETAIVTAEKAQAEVEDAEAKLAATQSKAKVAEAMVDVARSDVDEARAMRDYAIIRAPFDGMVVRRKVDPGSFVQSATTGHPTPLLSLQRTDIVTVTMRVPDNFAPYVMPGTEAILELDALRGVKIRGAVTRFAPSLLNDANDRTMRVEVDLWNRSPEDYKAFLATENAKPIPFDDLQEARPPLLPQLQGRLPSAHSQTLILPGMIGRMTLVLRKFQGARLVPVTAIVSHGGRPFIYLVQDGVAHLQPVEVEIEDGKVALVQLLDSNGAITGGLTGDEVVIVSNQGELSEGQPVEPTLVENWQAVTRQIPH